MQTIVFNTGRQYSAEGQVIVATLHNDGTVTFFDHARQIDGQFTQPAHTPIGQTTVMRHYDSNDYQSTARSWADGMQPEGCNSRTAAEKKEEPTTAPESAEPEYKAKPIRQNAMPTTLNGFAVKAFTISKNAERALVLVHRPGNFMPWVAATWWPELGDEWQWGNYYRSYEEADEYRGNWIRTHGNRDDLPRIKITGKIGGFQE